MQKLPTCLQYLLQHHFLLELPSQLLLQSALSWNLLFLSHLKLPQLHLPQRMPNLRPWFCKCGRPLSFLLQPGSGMSELHNRWVWSQHKLHLLHCWLLLHKFYLCSVPWRLRSMFKRHLLHFVCRRVHHECYFRTVPGGLSKLFLPSQLYFLRHLRPWILQSTWCLNFLPALLNPKLHELLLYRFRHCLLGMSGWILPDGSDMLDVCLPLSDLQCQLCLPFLSWWTSVAIWKLWNLSWRMQGLQLLPIVGRNKLPLMRSRLLQIYRGQSSKLPPLYQWELPTVPTRRAPQHNQHNHHILPGLCLPNLPQWWPVHILPLELYELSE